MENNQEIERIAQELEIIGADNADWIAVAKYVQKMILEARISELKVQSKSVWFTADYSIERIKKLNKKLSAIKDKNDENL